MYRLSADNNDIEFFRDRQDVKRCSACAALLDKWKEDLSAVPRFRACVEENAITGVEFKPLQAGLFSVRPRVSVPFDAERRGTRFLKQCQVCGQYESVVGATPVFLAANAVIPARGFVRTDLEFGSFEEKSPVELCGDEAAKILISANLKGLTLVSNSKEVAKA